MADIFINLPDGIPILIEGERATYNVSKKPFLM